MNEAPLDFGDRVVVRVSDRTKSSGTAGWHGVIAGKSYEDDDPSLSVVAYGVAMDEDGERVWMVEPEDLSPAEG